LIESKRFEVPADDPGAVLLRLVRRLKLPYSARLVSAVVSGHPQPQSLLALVQVAPTLGLRITAARVEPEGLDDLSLPAIAHFKGEPGGFGVIEALDAGHVEVWDSRRGRRRVPRAAFLAAWSGIVALAERDDSERKVEPGHRRQRMVEALTGSGSRPDLATPAVGAFLAALLAALVAAAVWRHPPDTRVAAAIVTVVTLAALAVSATLSRATAEQTANVNVPGCPRGKLVNCESVLNSPYSRVRGVSLSDAGTGFFGGVVLTAAVTAVAGGTAAWAAIALAYLAAVPVVLLLIGTQVAMRRFCTLCLAIHALVLAGAAAAWPLFRASWPGDDAAVAGALLALFGGGVAFLVIPFLTRHTRTQQMIKRQQRLATSPYSTLAYLLTEAPSEVRGAACGFRLPGPPAPHEVVLYAHPTCGQCAQMIEELTALAEAGAIEAYVTILPRYPSGPERDACVAVVAAAVAFGPAALLHAYFYAKKSFGALMSGDPVELLAGEMSVRRDALDDRLAEARTVIDRAEALADGLIEGTPAVFFDSRLYPYNTPVAQLTGLLAKHPELFPPRGEGREPRGPREAAPA
jgi:uncharacterized membrane protein